MIAAGSNLIILFWINLAPSAAAFVYNRCCEDIRITHCFTSSARCSRAQILSSVSATPRKIPTAPRRARAAVLAFSATSDEDEILAWEKEVMASTQARLDLQRLQQAVFDDDDDAAAASRTTAGGNAEGVSSQVQVAIAAAGVTAGVIFLVTHNVVPSILALGTVFFVAQQDPNGESNVAGAIARILGRTTIRSVEASKPKVKALARAVVTGDDQITSLKSRIEDLEAENRDLRRWKRRKIAVDKNMPRYTLQELKVLSKDNELAVTGTKTELLARLVEAGIIQA